MIKEFERDSEANVDSPFEIWRIALLKDAATALEDLLSGAGARGAQQHSEPADFLADLLAHHVNEDARGQLIEGLDAAMLKWLNDQRAWPPSRIIEYGTRAYRAQISDALEVAARLPLKVTGSDMVRTHSAWDDWFHGLRLPGDIDLLRQFDMVLIQKQTDDRFAPRWFAACEEAAWGWPYWQTKLRTGLLGLRKIPAADGTRPELVAAAGLVEFSVLGLSRRTIPQAQVESTFRRQAGALAVLYPRHAEHWRDVWAELLDRHRESMSENADIVSSVAAWIDHAETADSGTPRKASVYYAELPPRDERLQIQREISGTDTLEVGLWDRIRRLIDDHWRYALDSGNSHYAVRTTVNLCNRVLSRNIDRSYVEKIYRWAVQATEAEPGNPYAWDFWAKVLLSLGHEEDAVAVRWESMRRFPENVVLRGSLAHTLVRQGKLVLAEALLRQTTIDFPHDVVIRHILTLMLWKQGRRDEAAGEADDLEKLAPERDDFKRLSTLIRQRDRLSDEDFDRDLINLHGQGFGHIGKLGYDPATLWTPRLVSKGPVIALASEDAGPVTAYVAQLKDRTRWIELFFAPPTNGTGSQLDALRKEALTSESALVAAHRAGLMDKSEIHSWVNARPSSYSARLLLALRGNKGLDQTAMQQISSDFPQHRQWNRWLCSDFSSLEERNQLRNEAQTGTSADSWMDRLTAVYPVLAGDEGEGAASFDPVGQRRLVEEIAFAAAERAVPSLARAA